MMLGIEYLYRAGSQCRGKSEGLALGGKERERECEREHLPSARRRIHPVGRGRKRTFGTYQNGRS